MLRVQKQPAKRRSSAAGKGGARGSKAAAAATLAPSTGVSTGAAAGPSRQDWRTAKVQKSDNAVPIGKQLKVSVFTGGHMRGLKPGPPDD